ncbi:hypothetical protein ACLBWT_17100 [Paenibacillus sp. D51F]
MSDSIESMLQYLPHEALQRMEDELHIYSKGRRAIYFVNEENMDRATGAWALDTLLLRWLQYSTISDDPRSVSNLNYLLKEYNRENSDANLSLEELVSNGWVRIVWDTYHLPSNFIFHRKNVNEQSEHLFRFMKRLSEVPYPDSCVILLQNASQILQEHQSYYPGTPEFAWFLECEIIIEKEGGYVLNYRSNYVALYGSFLLSRLWMERVVGPSNSDHRLNWWIRYEALVGYSGDIIHLISSSLLGDLLDACLNRLLRERDGLSWEAERRRMAAEALAESGSGQMEQYVSGISLPREDHDLEKLFWFDRPSEAAIVIHRPRELLQQLFHWVMRGEGIGTPWPDRPRLQRLLSERKDRPFLYHYLRNADAIIIPTLLTHPDFVVVGIALLALWEPSYPGDYFSRETREEAWKVEERLWFNSFAYLNHTVGQVLHVEQGVVAKWFEEILTWFEKRIRRNSFQSPVAQSSKLQRKREHLLVWLRQKLMERDAASYEAILLQHWSDGLLKVLDGENNPLAHLSFPQLLWLIELNKYGGPVEQIEEMMGRVIQYYSQTHQHCRDGWIWIDRIANVLMHPAWNLVAVWAMQKTEQESEDDKLLQLLRPFQMEDLQKEIPQDEDKQYSWNRMTSDRIAIHLNRLAGWVTDLRDRQDTTGYRTLVSAFSSLLVDSHKQYGEVMFQPFGPSLGYTPMFFRDEPNLVVSVSSAINVLSDEHREHLIQDLLKVQQDPGLWAQLYSKFERDKDKQVILSELSGRKDELLPEGVGWGSELRVKITELLNTQNAELASLASKCLEKFRSEASPRVQAEFQDWMFREQLRIYLVKKEYDQILNCNAQPVAGNQANTLSFYRALAYLDMDPPNIDQAVVLLEPLVREDAGNISYLVNLYAAYIRSAVAATEIGEQSTSEVFVAKANGLLARIQALPKETIEAVSGYIDTNRLFMESVLNNSSAFWQIYGDLDYGRQHSIPIGTYAVQILLHEQKWEEAERKLEILHQRHGEFESYTELVQTVRERRQATAQLIPPHRLLQELLQWPSISTALRNLSMLDSEDQVKAMKGDDSVTIQDYILETFLDICREVLKFSPSITPSTTQQAEEDRYTDLLVLLLNQRLLPIGWSAVSQSRGGYTGKAMGHRGGIGERDIIIQNRMRTELAIGEALNLGGFSTSDIKVHTQKIFGYDTTRCYFHIVLTWGFAKNPDDLWSKYKALVASKKDQPFPVVDWGEAMRRFPRHDFRGLRSIYSLHETDTEAKQALVVHLYVDVLSEKIKEAAEKARK